ncbi:MAG: hypothetical protein ACREE6_12585 [Limisphaerales bacterium]
MANCPTCKVDLQTVRQRDGIYYFCSQCNGRAVTAPQIRRMTGDRFAPAWAAFVLWFLLQLFGTMMQMAGLSSVSSLSNLGGVATGFLFWLLWRGLGAKKPADVGSA